jgi:hypothetical protein
MCCCSPSQLEALTTRFSAGGEAAERLRAALALALEFWT